MNFGIVPLLLDRAEDLAALRAGDRILIEGLREAVRSGDRVIMRNACLDKTVSARLELSARGRRILLAGGLLNDIRNRADRARTEAPR